MIRAVLQPSPSSASKTKRVSFEALIYKANLEDGAPGAPGLIKALCCSLLLRAAIWPRSLIAILDEGLRGKAPTLERELLVRIQRGPPHREPAILVAA